MRKEKQGGKANVRARAEPQREAGAQTPERRGRSRRRDAARRIARADAQEGAKEAVRGSKRRGAVRRGAVERRVGAQPRGEQQRQVGFAAADGRNIGAARAICSGIRARAQRDELSEEGALRLAELARRHDLRRGGGRVKCGRAGQRGQRGQARRVVRLRAD